MENKNKVTKSKKRFSIIDAVIVLIFIFIFLIITLNYGEIKVKNPKMNNQDLVFKTFVKVSETPLDINYKNKNVQKEAVAAGKSLIPLYVILICVYIMKKKKKGDFKGIEYGSAGWASKNDKKKFQKNKDGIVLSNELFLDIKTDEVENLNELIIGISGSGKSYRKIKPTLMNMYGSYVITDPKGELYKDCKYFLEANEYKVKVLNLLKPKFSNQYNPFRYLDLYNEDTLETDILSLTDTFMANTEDPSKKGGDKFWDDASKAVLNAISFYLVLERPKEEQNYETIFDIIRKASPKDEDDGELEEDNSLESIFDGLKEKDPFHPAVKCYEEFKLAAGKTAKSILISLAVRMNIFIAKDICTLTERDEMELEKIGTEKTAVFIIIPETDQTFKVIASMFYSQLFKILFYEADFRQGGSLPLFVNGLLDEFANIGEIPDFDKYISTMRSRNVGVSVVIQALSQLEKTYKEHWETILGNCAVLNYLGTTDQKTLKYICEKLGKTTVRVDTSGYSKGRQSSRNENINYIARDLMTTTEIFEMDKSDSIVFLKGFKPFYTKKYETSKHKLSKIVGSTKYNPGYCTDIKKEFLQVAKEREERYKAKQIEKLRLEKIRIENENIKMQLKIQQEMEMKLNQNND